MQCVYLIIVISICCCIKIKVRYLIAVRVVSLSKYAKYVDYENIFCRFRGIIDIDSFLNVSISYLTQTLWLKYSTFLT